MLLEGNGLGWERVWYWGMMDGTPAVILDYKVIEAMPTDREANRRNFFCS